MKSKFKQGYKAAQSELRHNKRCRGKLIHVLINLKSYGIDIYTREREQLNYILYKNKTWNDDVLSHFRRRYPRHDRPYDFRPEFGHRYNDKPVTFMNCDYDELPF